MKAGYRYRFYPTDQQKQDLAKLFGTKTIGGVAQGSVKHCPATIIKTFRQRLQTLFPKVGRDATVQKETIGIVNNLD